MNSNEKGEPGKLSLQEMKFIKDNAETMSIEDIATKLTKSEETVRKFMYRKNLLSKEDLDAAPDAHRRVKIRDTLRKKHYYVQLQKQFTPAELVSFEDYFVSFYIDFDEDARPGEETQLKKFITLEILRDRMLEEDKKCAEQIAKIEEMLSAEYALPPDKKNPEAIKTLNNQMEKLNTSRMAFIDQYKEMTQEQKFVEKSLKISRDDRVKAVLDSTQNWTGNLKLLDNPSIREKLGKHFELMRIAKDKSKMLLSDYHKYLDNSLDRPILSKDTVGEKDEDSIS